MKFAPIILFTYNRPEHTAQTVHALKNNYLSRQSDLIIYADGPKDQRDHPDIMAVRDYLHTIKGFKSIEIIERDKNWGLADSIIDGVTTVINNYDRAIILEDDIVTSPFFLQYMNDALSFYNEEKKVMHISAYIDPIGRPLPSTFFSQICSCWGWATWADRWSKFNNNPHSLYDKIKSNNKLYAFDLDNSGIFLPQLLANIYGTRKTWAILWQASVFLENGLALHPGQTLTKNIGFDGSGEHCPTNHLYINQKVSIQKTAITSIPIQLHIPSREIIKDFYFYEGELNLYKRKLIKIRKYISNWSKRFPALHNKLLYYWNIIR